MRAAHRLSVTIAVLTLAMVTGCASSSAKSIGTTPTGSPSPVATATATATPEPALTIDAVTADLGPISQNNLWYFAGGHWLYADDLNDTIVYDGKLVAHGHPVTAALSQNGLHYAYTLADGLSVYVDGRSVTTGTYLPEVFAVSDDGSTVLYSDTDGFNGPGAIYRNGTAIFNAPVSIGEAVGSADAMHYTAVVDGGRSVASLVYDGRTVATSGITGSTTPMISPGGSHYGVYTTGDASGVTSVDGVAVLPAGDSGLWGEVTDSGHWVVLDGAAKFAPRVDGVIDGPPAAEAVINNDASDVAVYDSVAGMVLVNGKQVAKASIDTYLDLVGNTLYIYDIVTSS
jgi:hypothetical protein